MKTPQDINNVPREVIASVEASQLPTITLIAELRNRGFTVEDNTAYDSATGLLKWRGDSEYYFEVDTRKLVPISEVYARAAGGW